MALPELGIMEKNLKVFVVQFTHRQGHHGIIFTDSSLYASKADAIGRLKEYRQEYIEDNQIKNDKPYFCSFDTETEFTIVNDDTDEYYSVKIVEKMIH